MKLNIIILFLLLFSLNIGCSNHIKTKYIISVYDGDTFKDNEKNTYRLFGVDTPEIKDSNLNYKMNNNLRRIYALKAKNKIKELILNQKIKITYIKEDKYNRKIIKAEFKNQDLGFLLIKSGLAIVRYISLQKNNPFFTNDFKYYQKLLIFQKEAFDNKRGIWLNYEKINYIF